jgi:hypothetical protein
MTRVFSHARQALRGGARIGLLTLAAFAGAVAPAVSAVTSLTPRCGASPDPNFLRAEACGEWTAERQFVRWAVTTVDPTGGVANTLFPTALTLPPTERCRLTITNPTLGFGDGVHTQRCQVAHPPAGGEWFPAGGPAEVTIRVDETPPIARAVPERPPDANGWYTAPIRIRWVGYDGGSGIARCTTPVIYAGPDTTTRAAVTGTCTDQVGHTSDEATAEIRYDTTPPALTNVRARATPTRVRLDWETGEDTARIVVRRTNRTTGRSAVIYDGTDRTFLDRAVVSSGRYAYTITAFDQAGVSASAVVGADVAALLTPRAGAQIAATPITLKWPTVSGAQYYNVQLFIGTRKVLSAWPTAPQFRITRSWTYRGARFVLPNRAKVRWYVWPAVGPTTTPQFGPMVGASTFRVRV